MPRIHFVTLAALTLAAGGAGSVHAETSVSMNVVRAVETEEGGTEYQTVETAVPGEPLIYRIRLENTDPVPATAVGLSLPLDGNIAIDPTSVSSGKDLSVEFSTDGGESFASFGELTVEENGEVRQAQSTDLTNLRVEIEEIAPDSEVTVEYDAVVR